MGNRSQEKVLTAIVTKKDRWYGEKLATSWEKLEFYVVKRHTLNVELWCKIGQVSGQKFLKKKVTSISYTHDNAGTYKNELTIKERILIQFENPSGSTCMADRIIYLSSKVQCGTDKNGKEENGKYLKTMKPVFEWINKCNLKYLNFNAQEVFAEIDKAILMPDHRRLTAASTGNRRLIALMEEIE